jgi:hypothetical protein
MCSAIIGKGVMGNLGQSSNADICKNWPGLGEAGFAALQSEGAI